MKKSSTSKGAPDQSKGGFNCREIDWELRAGGMLVQKREVVEDTSGPLIKIKVSHGSSYHYDITIPAQSTFGDLKKVLAQETGLESKEQRLLFGGKEKEDIEYLHMVGVKDMSKVILLEDPASKEKKLEEMKSNQGIFKAYEAVAKVRTEVDKLLEKVAALEITVSSGVEVSDKEFVVLIELLTMQLLKLDAIEANGEAKVQRRIEKKAQTVVHADYSLKERLSVAAPFLIRVCRVQSFVDALDNLKARNLNLFSSNSSKAVSATTKWETFEPGIGSLTAHVPVLSATKITQDWELFD